MTSQENNGVNDEFGKFRTSIRDESIEVIPNLLDPRRTDLYSTLIKRIYLDTRDNSKGFSDKFVPALVDEVITVLLQRIDKAALNDRKVDILYSNDLGEDISDDSVYKYTGSLGSDYIDEWRRKFGKHKVIDLK